MNKKIFASFSLFLMCALLLLPSVVLASPLTGADTDLTAYINYTMMGGYTNDTTDANDANNTDDADNGGADILWTAGGNPDTQFRYIGYSGSTFSKVLFNIDTATGNTNELMLQYYNGSSWSNLSITSGATSLQSTGIQTVQFTVPEDWASTTVNSVEAYFIRTNTSAGNSGIVVRQISVYVGGGVPTPEFSTWVLLLSLGLGGAYVLKESQKVSLA